MSLYKRKTVWWIRFTTPDGRRVRRSTGTEDRTQAQEYHDQVKAEVWRAARLGEKPKRRSGAPASETSVGTIYATPGRAGMCNSEHRYMCCRSGAVGKRSTWCAGMHTLQRSIRRNTPSAFPDPLLRTIILLAENLAHAERADASELI